MPASTGNLKDKQCLILFLNYVRVLFFNSTGLPTYVNDHYFEILVRCISIVI